MSKSKKAPAPPAPAAPVPLTELPAHWPKSLMGELKMATIQPSPLNPRKTFEENAIEELAESIKEKGLISPIVVRPIIGKADWKDGRWVTEDGVAWEIVAGERRFRACQHLELADVPVIVRPLTDTQALEVMLIENDQRKDVRPSEQAAAYKALADQIGVEAVAQRTGRPLGQVRDLIRLARLPAWHLAAVDAGVIARSTAAIVARVPGERAREQAAAESLGCWKNWNEQWPSGAKLEKVVAKQLEKDDTRDPWTAEDARRQIAQRYCRELKSAPFDRKSLTLVPDAGSCDACPKRAGNDPELKADGVREDVCTDTDCYAAKVAAWKKDAVAKAVEKGFQPVPEGFEWPDNHSMVPQGWVELSDQKIRRYGDNFERELADAGHEGKTIRSLLPKDFSPVYVVIHDDKLVKLAKPADVRKALVAAKKLTKEKASKKAGKVSRELSDWTIDERLGLLVARSARDKVAQASNLKDGLLLVAKALVRQSGGGTELWEDLDPAGFVPTLDASLSQMKPADLLGWIVGAVTADVWSSYNGEEKLYREQINAFCGYGADELKNLRKLAVDSLKAEAKKGATAA